LAPLGEKLFSLESSFSSFIVPNNEKLENHFLRKSFPHNQILS